jgi:hypothetical protein
LEWLCGCGVRMGQALWLVALDSTPGTTGNAAESALLSPSAADIENSLLIALDSRIAENIEHIEHIAVS